MKKRLRDTRPKAIFGTQEAATLASAGIMAAATAAAAQVGKKATTQAAKTSADAITRSAHINADALEQQNEVTREMTEQSIQANEEVNEENRQLQKDLQMTIQMIGGQENMNEVKKENKIVAKNGTAKSHKPSLRVGYSNQRFAITDGGFAALMGITPEGYELYELKGDNHDQYHKTRGKYKSGVGVKFDDGKVIEGEGNGKGNQGELVLSTPNDVLFISKHTIKGFNPAEAVKSGMHPLKAFALQEGIKDVYNISDSGNKRAKMGCRKLRLAGGNVNLQNYALNGGMYPLSADNSAIIGGAVIASSPVEEKNINVAKNGKRIRLKNGGCRAKAWNGGNAIWLGSLINAGANIGGAAITASGNKKAGKIMNKGYTKAGNILYDAYGRLVGIDEGFINKKNYYTSEFLPVVRSARVNVNPQITKVDRTANKLMEATDNTTASSAARLARKGKISSNAVDQRSAIYADQLNREEQIAQGNAERLSEAAAKNAELKMQGNREYMNALLEVKRFNADVKNQSILGQANALASAITQGKGALAQGISAARQAWGSGVAAAGQNIATGLQGYANYKLHKDWFDAYNSGKGLGNTQPNTKENNNITPTNSESAISPITNNSSIGDIMATGTLVNPDSNSVLIPSNISDTQKQQIVAWAISRGMTIQN